MPKNKKNISQAEQIAAGIYEQNIKKHEETIESQASSIRALTRERNELQQNVSLLTKNGADLRDEIEFISRRASDMAAQLKNISHAIDETATSLDNGKEQNAQKLQRTLGLIEAFLIQARTRQWNISPQDGEENTRRWINIK